MLNLYVTEVSTEDFEFYQILDYAWSIESKVTSKNDIIKYLSEDYQFVLLLHKYLNCVFAFDHSYWCRFNSTNVQLLYSFFKRIVKSDTKYLDKSKVLVSKFKIMNELIHHEYFAFLDTDSLNFLDKTKMKIDRKEILWWMKLLN